MCGTGVFYGSATSTVRRRGPSAPQVSGSLLFLCTPFWRRTTEFDKNTYGEAACFRGPATATFQKCVSPAPQFLRFPLYMTIIFEEVRPNWAYELDFRWSATLSIPRRNSLSGQQYGEGCYRRSATPLHVHKCVAQFVSDSWVSYL